jgi:hypothetical protein
MGESKFIYFWGCDGLIDYHKKNLKHIWKHAPKVYYVMSNLLRISFFEMPNLTPCITWFF